MFTRTESFSQFIRYYPMVSLIVLIHIVLYLLTILPIFPSSLLFEKFAGVNLYVVEGEVWRLVTPIFMHSGFTHMLFNSFSLVLFGPALEQMVGKFKFILFYLLTGILANVATLLFTPLTYTHVGSSGAIFGLFGIYLSLTLFRKNAMSRENSQLIITIAVIGLIMTFIQPNINITAHIFGLLSGFIIGTIAFGKRGEVFQTIRHAADVGKYRANPKTLSFSPKLLVWLGIIVLALLGVLSR